MKDFIITKHIINTDKLSNDVSFCVFSDLHDHEYGRHNIRLISRINRLSPDAILVPGDMIVFKKPEHYHVTETLFKSLTRIAPVYFSNGNHEMKAEALDSPCRTRYLKLKCALKAMGVHFLNNRSENIQIGESRLKITGLDLPKPYFARFSSTKMSLKTLYGYIGEPEAGIYNILLAHTPQYARTYAAAGYDLALCGHYHGGLICLPKTGKAVISPSFHLFPEFSCGDTVVGRTHIITGRGLGTHRYNIRINNPAELLHVTLRSCP